MYDADYSIDTGVYKCQGHNAAGMGEAAVAVTVHNPNNTDQQPGTLKF